MRPSSHAAFHRRLRFNGGQRQKQKIPQPARAALRRRDTRYPAQALYAELLAGAAVADALRAAGRAAPALAAAYHCAHLSGGEVAWLGASPDT
jgi:hypothetical protein